MSSSFPSSILYLPNLQGTYLPMESQCFDIQKARIGYGLQEDLKLLEEQYQGQQLMLGVSYGGLLAWKYAVQYSPPELRGVILIDCLPSIAVFPRWRRTALMLSNRTPLIFQVGMYQFYRLLRGDLRSDSYSVIRCRLNSILMDFPRGFPAIPVLTLLSSDRFVEGWTEQAEQNPQVMVSHYSRENMQLDMCIQEFIGKKVDFT